MNRWLLLILALAVLAAGASLFVWTNRADLLPPQVPTHWDINSQPDQWVPRDQVFWWLMIMPLLLAGWAGLTAVLPWLSPAHFKVEPFRATYDYIMGLIGLMFFYLNGVILASQLQRPSGEQLLNGEQMVRWLVGGLLV